MRQDKRDPERHAPLRVRAGDREQPEFLLRAESPADVLGLGQRLVGLTHEMPEFELLQDSAQDSDLDVDGAVPDAFQMAQ